MTNIEKNKTAYAWMVKTNDAQEINQEHELFVNDLRNSLIHAQKIGEALILKKDEVWAGEWQPWVKLNCDFPMKIAERYINIATKHINFSILREDELNSLVRKLIPPLDKPNKKHPPKKLKGR